MDERVANFLSNWIDANILHPSQDPDHDPERLQAHFPTDAVAAGLYLDDVNADWAEAELQIQDALHKRAGRTAH
jgi:hypothetical protein